MIPAERGICLCSTEVQRDQGESGYKEEWGDSGLQHDWRVKEPQDTRPP